MHIRISFPGTQLTSQPSLWAKHNLVGYLHVHQIWHQSEVLLQHLLVSDGTDGFILKPAHWYQVIELAGQCGNLKLPDMQYNTDKQEEQTLKQSTFNILPGLLHSHLPYCYIINHHNHLSFASCNFTTEWLHKFQLSHNPVTLSEHQGHSNWNQAVEFSSV